MPIAVGDRLGPYEIQTPIGSGGMGDVWMARDTRLGRSVAIKISQEKFSERFEREARAIAALNHPNICQLYDVGPNYLVMEYIEGETLSEILRKGPCAYDEAIRIAGQICAAVEAAHEKHIIHRDLKPGNVKIKPDGTVKVLDFGLAKVGGTPVALPADSPTVTLGHVKTEAGVVLGTAAYMSPEQARGKEVDKRADIWAFGVVFFEMLTGRRLFRGDDSSDILASVIKEEPDLTEVPAKVRLLLRRCLEKDPKKRLRDIGDAMALITASEDTSESRAVADKSSAWSKPLPWIPIAAALLILAGGALWAMRTGMFGERHALYVQLAPPEGSEFATFGSGAGGFALSPDGKTVAFIAKTEGKNGLWVRDVDRPTARLLPGTEGAGTPIWSPDGKSVAFPVPGKFQRVELSGGAPLTICERCGGSAAWSGDGRIILGNQPGLVQVPASGGAPSDFFKLDESHGEIRYVYPQIISRDRIMYWAGNKKAEDSSVYVASLSNPADRVKILTSISNAVYATDNQGKGYLLFIRGVNLMAQEFDASARKLSGEPRAIADSVAYTGTLGHAELSASTAGSLLYTSPIRYQFTWFDRTGKPLGKVGDLGEYITFRLSPDGHRIVASRDLPTGTDLWMIDVDRGSASRFTFTGTYHFPAWSPDGKVVMFNSFADPRSLYRKNMSGSASEERIEFPTRGHEAFDWSRDGHFVLYREGANLWVAPVHPDGSLAGKPWPYFVMAPFRVNGARFSPEPNPHWVAYQSNESGRDEIYIQAFPQPKGKIQISTGGGRQAEWSPDGREIFYVSPEYDLMVVSVKVTGDTITPSAPQKLFHLPAMDLTSAISPFAVADAQKILVRVTPQQYINLIVDWPALLNKSAPAQ